MTLKGILVLILMHLEWGSCWPNGLFCSYSLRILPSLPKSLSVRLCQLLCIKPTKTQLCRWNFPALGWEQERGRACRGLGWGGESPQVVLCRKVWEAMAQHGTSLLVLGRTFWLHVFFRCCREVTNTGSAPQQAENMHVLSTQGTRR